MSRDNVNREQNQKTDINWKLLIEHSEAEIKVCLAKVKALRKSCSFFKKQAGLGIPFPLQKEGRHKEIS